MTGSGGALQVDLPDYCVVLSVVLMVLTCHLMKPLDWGKWGEEVMWCM